MAKKAASKKATKKAVKKTAANKAPAPKAVAQKAVAQKAPVKKAVKKVAPKKAPATPKAEAPAKKKAVKKVEKTTITARVDVGFGNSLFLRGEGAGLSWEKGVELENVSPYEWTWTSTSAKSDVVFKFLINDEIWSEGENLTVSPGGSSVTTPIFP